MKIYLIGFMGSGKTYWGRRISQERDLLLFDLDEAVERAEQKSVKEIFADAGESYFRMKERELLHQLTENHADFIMSCGGGAPCHFDNMEYMNRSGITIWLNVSEDILFHRLIDERDHRPLLKELNDETLRAFIRERLASRQKYYQQAQYIVEDDDAGLNPLIEKLFHA